MRIDTYYVTCHSFLTLVTNIQIWMLCVHIGCLKLLILRIQFVLLSASCNSPFVLEYVDLLCIMNTCTV